MEEDSLTVQEKKFSSKEFKAKYERTLPVWKAASPSYLNPIYEEESGVLEYLNSVCMSDLRYKDKHPNFFDGEVLAHIIYDKKHDGAWKVGEGPFKYKEHVTIRYQPSNKEPSLLIKMLTGRFGLEEVKPSN